MIVITKEEFEYRIENNIDATVEWIENNCIYKGRAVQHTYEDIVDIGFGEGYVRFITSEYFKVLQFHNGHFRRFEPSKLSFMYDVINHKANDLYKIWEGGL